MSRQSTVVDNLSIPLNETKPMFFDWKTQRVRRASSTEMKPNGNSGVERWIGGGGGIAGASDLWFWLHGELQRTGPYIFIECSLTLFHREVRRRGMQIFVDAREDLPGFSSAQLQSLLQTTCWQPAKNDQSYRKRDFVQTTHRK